MILLWSDLQTVGVKRFDEDHKHLIEIVDDLHRATQNLNAGENAGLGEVKSALHRLENYIKYHCLSEEKAMAQSGYPGLEAHKAEHDKLVDMVAEMGVRFRGSVSPRDAEEIMDAMRDWVIQHVNVVDKQFTQFLNAAGIY